MTLYELARVAAAPILPALHARIQCQLRELLRMAPGRKLLDVGGRSSPYTSGLDAEVTIVDLPREDEIQKHLRLGVDDELMAKIKRRRSNVVDVRIEDMRSTTLADGSFDLIVAVEVLEHVEEDEEFVAQIARVLRPGGWFYLTTPNGDYIKNEPPDYNPDHVRHYTRSQLTELLRRHFDEVEVVYAIKTGRHRYRGLRSFELRRPFMTLVAMLSNIVSQWESRGLDQQPRRTAHLVGRVSKRSPVDQQVGPA